MAVGSVHMSFDGNFPVHFDGASDWTLRCHVSRPGDNSWMNQYGYAEGGRWSIRDASQEMPFVGAVGRRLLAAEPITNEMQEAVGTGLTFEGKTAVRLVVANGEIGTSSCA